jgi:hypothetical protein
MGVGPLFVAPISEAIHYSHHCLVKWRLKSTSFMDDDLYTFLPYLFTIWLIPGAVANSFGTLLAGRMLGGLTSAAL